MGTAITLVATEIADVLRHLPPDARLATLALAASKTILGLPTASGGNADGPLAALSGLVAVELHKASAQTALPAKTFLDEVRELFETPPRGPLDRLTVIMKSSRDAGIIMIVQRDIARHVIGYRSHFYGSNDDREVWETFGQEIMKPLGFSWPKFKELKR